MQCIFQYFEFGDVSTKSWGQQLGLLGNFCEHTRSCTIVMWCIILNTVSGGFVRELGVGYSKGM